MLIICHPSFLEGKKLKVNEVWRYFQRYQRGPIGPQKAIETNTFTENFFDHFHAEFRTSSCSESEIRPFLCRNSIIFSNLFVKRSFYSAPPLAFVAQWIRRRTHNLDRGLVRTGSMGSAEPANFWAIIERNPQNFDVF